MIHYQMMKKFYQRKLTKQGNYTLQRVASAAGVKIWLSFIMQDIKDYIRSTTNKDNYWYVLHYF